MMRVVARRIALSIPLLLFVSFTVFVLISFMPGDPAVTLAGSNPELVPFIRHSLNLDQPLLLRYWDWLSQAVQGNLGLTWRGLAVSDHESVLGLILARAPITASIALRMRLNRTC